MRAVNAVTVFGIGVMFLFGAIPAGAIGLCGDANGDGDINVGDAVFVINYVFKGGPPPPQNCCDECTGDETRPCYSGPEGTENVGVCRPGVQSCVDGQWGPCEGEVVPGIEVCDGLDNNCDGQVDEGDPGGGGYCNTGLPGVCAAGTIHCQGGSLTCVQNVSPSAEVCDGLDNNCDGQVDEGDPGGGGYCNTGLPGVCADGTIHCQGGSLVCVQNVPASPEICDDGLDNDCDGAIDADDSDCQ